MDPNSRSRIKSCDIPIGIFFHVLKKSMDEEGFLFPTDAVKTFWAIDIEHCQLCTLYNLH